MNNISEGHKVVLDLLRDHGECGTVVDAGAWPGHLSRHLRNAGWDVIALDKEPNRPIEWNQLQLLDDNWRRSNARTFLEEMEAIGVETLSVDLERDAIPLASGSVDAVVLTEVIEHLWMDPLFCLSEINRVLKTGGVMILSTPNLVSIRRRISFVLGNLDRVIESPFVAFLKKRRVGHFGHIRLYAASELNALLCLLGFKSEFEFRSVQYHCPAVSQCDTFGESKQVSSGQVQRRSMAQKLIRSPTSYAAALAASSYAILEQWRPTLRSHIFVLATKCGGSNYEEEYPYSLKQLVSENQLAAIHPLDRALVARERRNEP